MVLKVSIPLSQIFFHQDTPFQQYNFKKYKKKTELIKKYSLE